MSNKTCPASKNGSKHLLSGCFLQRSRQHLSPLSHHCAADTSTPAKTQCILRSRTWYSCSRCALLWRTALQCLAGCLTALLLALALCRKQLALRRCFRRSFPESRPWDLRDHEYNQSKVRVAHSPAAFCKHSLHMLLFCGKPCECANMTGLPLTWSLKYVVK